MIKFENPVVASMISPNSVQDIPEATHVLVGIQWGIVAAVTLKCDRTNPNDISIENDLKVGSLKCILSSRKNFPNNIRSVYCIR